MPDSRTLSRQLKGDTGRLAGTYLAIILGLTLMFSGVIYAISSSQFDRPLPPRAYDGGTMQFDGSVRDSIQDLFEERAHQARAELLLSLIFLNLAVLLGGAAFSYFLARKSLQPIEAAMQSQARFVSDASHELRTPLTALQVTNEVALRKKKLTLAQAKELIGHNLSETIKLRRLSDSLLGLAKQDSADTTKSRIQLPELVSGVVETLRPLAHEKQIVIEHDVPAGVVTANAPAVTQILQALLDNAVKYAPLTSEVAVTGSHTSARTIISVTDTGPGIAPEHRVKVFDRFYRVDESRSSQHVEGSGLGLSIAKSIADRHGYEIGVESEPGSGSTFTLMIPK